MFHLFLDVCCNLFLSGCCICFTHILQQYVPNVSTISVLCCSKWFYVAVTILDVSCVSHTCCKCMFQMIHYFRCMFHSNNFHVASVLCCSVGDEPRASGLGARRVGGWWTGVLEADERWCYSQRALGVLVPCYSSRLLSAARAEREDGVRGDRRVQRQGKVRAWGMAKADEVGAKVNGGGLRGRLDAHVHPNVWALTTPK
jgi:hypothetical protein